MASIDSVPASLRRSRARLRAPLDGVLGRVAAVRAGPLVDRVIADIVRSRADTGDGAREMAGWTIHRARRATGSGVVAIVGPPSEPAVAIRTATEPRGLAGLVREHEALEAIASLGLPRSFLRLVPRPLAAGCVDDAGYIAELALPGEVVDPRRLSIAERAAFLESIGAAIRPLHDAAERDRRADERDLDAWVDGRITLVWGLVGDGLRDRAAEARLAAVATTLKESLLGRKVRTTRIHGDLWTGNVLFDRQAPDGIVVSGIVDWDSSADQELAFQDLLHLELYTRKLVTRTSLGAVIADALAAETGVAARTGGRFGGAAFDPGTLTHREALLLYWLRQVEQNLARSPDVASTPRWRQRNIDPVLACL